MSIETVRESLTINQLVGSGANQVTFEGDIIVPDVKPDIFKIIAVEPNLFIQNRDVIPDRVFVEGNVELQILYVCDGDNKTLKRLCWSHNFREDIIVLGARPNMKAQVYYDVDSVHHSIINERKLNVKVAVNFSADVYCPQKVEILKGVSNTPDVQILKKSSKINTFVGEGYENISLKDNLVIPLDKPDILELLKTEFRITGKDVKVTDNKVVVKGDFIFVTHYIANNEQRDFESYETAVPFTGFVSIPGLKEDMTCYTSFEIKNTSFKPSETEDNVRNILYNVDILASCKAYYEQNVDLVEDLYSPSANLEATSSAIRCNEVYDTVKNKLYIKDSVMVPIVKELKVLNIASHPHILTCKVLDSKVLVEGIVDLFIIYQNLEDANISSITKQVPFQIYTDLRGANSLMQANASLELLENSYSLEGMGNIDVRSNYDLNLIITQDNLLSPIDNVIELPAKIIYTPSLIVYYVRPGDSLWKIAKKYNTTIDNIKSVNVLTSDTIFPGQQLIILKAVIV